MQNIVKRARMLAGAVGLVGLTLGSASALADSLTRTTTFDYDTVNNTGLMVRSTVEPGDVNFRVQSDFGYDAFGNLTATTVSGAGITSRTTQTEYDVINGGKGRFPTTLKNALTPPHVTTQVFSAAFGEVTSVTDPNLVQSTVTLDTWGRKTLVVNGDLTRTVFQYQYCTGINGGTVDCIGQGPPNAAYRVVATPQDASANQIGQVITTYFDKLNREIAKDGQGLTGQQIRVKTDYDALGRVLQSSRPYFVGGTPLVTTFTYDALDRVTKEVRPDAGEINHAYHGLSVTDTNQLSQTLTTVKNSRGEVVSVTDNLSGITSFTYDPFGNLKTTKDPALNVISNTYDLYGRKTAMSDPDMGTWSYVYDVLGQLTSQTNARGETVTLSYDVLGRLTSRIDPPNLTVVPAVPGQTSTWTYDDPTFGKGKLNTASTNGFLRDITYDSKGRPIQTAVTVDSSTYNTSTTYNANGRIGTVTYPSGVGVTYAYNTTGFLTSITDTATTAPYWTANTYDAELHLTKQTFGNTIETYSTYKAETGRIETIKAGPGFTVQNLGFTFNKLGNLTQRVDVVSGATDDLSYDGLNRLTQAIISNPSLPLNVTKTVTYNAIGNITSKSDVGTYTYDPARVHAVASITGAVTASYSYDGNGNMLTGRGRTVTWTSFDMVSQITQGTNSVSFTYDSDHARLKQTSSDGSTKYYLNDSISGVMAEKIVGASQSVSWNNYIMLGGAMVALKVTGATTQTRYFHKDHLGSVVALTDETGAVVERDSFDAWGQRRTPAGQDDPLYPGQSITSQITRGYTGHEQLDSVGLIHMNGRIYEPVIGKMMSPDPTVPNPIDGQAYNRYTYVGNNPLSLTDPTGFMPDPPATPTQGAGPGHGNGIGSNGQIGNGIAAHNGRYLDTLGGLTMGDVDRLFPIGGVGGDPTQNQIAEGPSNWATDASDFMFGPGVTWDTADYWGAFYRGPWGFITIRGPQYVVGGLGTGIGELEELCGVCFDPGAMMSTGMAYGPPGEVFAVGELMFAKSIQWTGTGLRIIAGVEAAPTIGPRLIGSFEVPGNLTFGTTTFGNYAHSATASVLQDVYPEANFALSVKAGQTGVDVEVIGQESINAVGFQFGEIKPLTSSGEATFNRQIQNWDLPAPVQGITYDAQGNVYLGFR